MIRWRQQTLLPAVLALLLGPLLAPSVLAGSGFAAAAQEFDVDFDYVAGAPTRVRGADIGSIEERNTNIRYAFSPQVAQHFLLRLGAEWQRIALRVPNNAPLPHRLQQTSAIIGVDCLLTDQWLLRAEFQPGLYSDFEDIGWRDLNVPFVLAATCVVDADFQWFAGLHVNVYGLYPVWPALGLRWKFADEWTLNLILPHPRLEFDMNERLKVYVGGRVQAGTYRVGDDFGTDHGLPQLNHAVVDQYELRVGPGVAWKIRRNMTIELDAGYMVYREFNYIDKHVVLRSEPAPYGQLALHARF